MTTIGRSAPNSSCRPCALARLSCGTRSGTAPERCRDEPPELVVRAVAELNEIDPAHAGVTSVTAQTDPRRSTSPGRSGGRLRHLPSEPPLCHLLNPGLTPGRRSSGIG